MKRSTYLIFVLLFLFSFISTTYSQVDLDEIKSKLPKMLGASNSGTEYVIGFHPCWEESGPNNAVRIYVSSSVETEVRLTIPGLYPQPYMIKKTIPNNVIEFVLTPNEAQPYSRGAGGATALLKPTQVWKGRGIIIESDDPIIVYGMVRYQYTSDGFLALPVNALGKDYIISSYRETANFTSQSLTPYADIIGVFDNTTVRFHIGGNQNSRIRTLDDMKWKPFEVITAVLNRGDFWLIASEGAQSDLGGGWIEADKPVSVISGTHCSYVPTENSACDFLIEQELPTISYGKKYYVTPIVDRKKASIIRIFCKDAPTTFYRDGVMQFELFTNWGLQEDAWRELRSNPDSNRGATFTSDKPSYIMQYNTGMSEDGVPSDPFQMMVMPVEFFQNELIFNTPGIRGGYGFTRNYVNVVYKAINNQIPDDLEFGVVIPNGETNWQKLKDFSLGLGTKLNDPDYIGTDTAVYSKILTIPYDGVYRLRCLSQKIMAYSYGFGSWDSYGYPVGGVFMENGREDKILPEPTIVDVQGSEPYLSQSTEAHGYVQDIDDKGEGNLALIVHNMAYSNNTKLSFNKFIHGETKRVDFTVSMVDSTKDALAILTFGDRSGNDTTISIEFKAKELVKFIKVIKPNNTNKYIQGNTMPIEWTSNFPEDVKIELYRADTLVLVISPSLVNKGSTQYKISTIATKSKNYRVKVSSTLEPNVFSYSEEFEIVESSVKKTLTLIQPNTTAKIQRGKRLQIVWLQSIPFPVNIDLYYAFVPLQNLVKDFNETYYNWDIPLSLAIFDKYKIRISDANDSSLFVESEWINILPDDSSKILTFNSPKSTTKIKIGSVLPITWDCNFTENIKIELFKNNNLEMEIANDIANTKMNYWSIPKNLPESKQYSIKISESGKPNVSFMSENFEIYDPVSVNESMITPKELKLSPNPANTELNLELLNNDFIQSITIFSLIGRNELSVSNLYESKTKIDISNLSVGKYILEIQTSKGKLTGSFLIVR